MCKYKTDYKIFLIITFLIVILFSNKLLAQSKTDIKSYKLTINTTTKASQKLIKKYSYTDTFTDSTELILELENILNFCFDKGYLTSRFDSLVFNGTFVNVSLFTGVKYNWLSVSYENINEGVIRKLGYTSDYFDKKIVRISEIDEFKHRLLNYYENSGYPFASVKFENITLLADSVRATLVLTKNSFFEIDSLIIKGNSKISIKYLQRYLAIKQNKPYNEKNIKNISNKIGSLGFVKETKPFEIEFKRNNVNANTNKADVYLYLKKRKSNRINGVIGFMPDNKVKRKLVLTGDLNLFLQNSFGKGEIISLDWKRPENASQKLNLVFAYPYLFNSPLGCELTFNLHKKDSTYLTLVSGAGIQLFMQNQNQLKLYVKNFSSSLIGQNDNDETNPNFADIKTVLYGIGYKYENLNYRYNPRRGVDLDFSVATGTKQIEKQEKLMQIDTKLKAEWYIPVMKKMTIKLKTLSAYIYSSQIFENELYRLGGINTLRGHDDESLLASAYAIGSIEFRFLYERNSNIFLFFETAGYTNEANELQEFDFPLGFGIGANIETKAGIFSLNYALGRQQNNPIEIRTAKIHFGYISRF